MDIQEPLKKNMIRTPQSIKKRLTAQPLNGSSIITIGSSSSTQTRVEIPSGCNYLGDIELGYTMSLSGPVATTEMVFMPATFVPEIQRIEIYLADSSSRWVDLQNANIYSRMTSSLFNDYKKRTVTQRMNFCREIANNKIAKNFADNEVCTANPFMMSQGTSVTYASQQQFLEGTGNNAFTTQTAVPTYTSVKTVANSNFSDGYFNDALSRTVVENNANPDLVVPSTDFNQQEYLPMGYFSTGADNNTTITLYPIQYNFNYKLKDFLHDSILSNLKCEYHKSNLVIIIYWQPVNQILFQVPTAVATTTAGAIATAPTKKGSPKPYSLSPNLNISDLFVRYYVETNSQLIETIMNEKHEVAYPFLYQANLNLSPGVGGQVGVNLIIGDEGESRLYRIYCGLQGQAGTYNFLPSDNFSNIQYKKWNGNFEFYLNSDLYYRLLSQYGELDALMEAFKDGSINNTIELQNHGIIAINFDSSLNAGKVNEYDENVLKGKYCNQFTNVNPRWITVQNDGGTNTQCNYTAYIFAVIMRRGYMEKGEFKTN